MRRGAAVLGALALLAAFLVVRFPYERLLPPLLEVARSATGRRGRGSRAPAAPRLGRAARRREGRGAALAGEPAARVRRGGGAGRPGRWRGCAGARAGTLDLSGPPGVWSGQLGRDRLAGKLEEFDVAALPWQLVGTPSPLKGRISGVVDLEQRGGVWLGSAEIAGGTGSVDLAGLPVAIPFEALSAKLDLARTA